MNVKEFLDYDIIKGLSKMEFNRRLKAFATMVHSNRGLWQWLLPGTKFDYASKVGEGLDSSVLVGVLLWIMRRFGEAAMVVSIDDEYVYDHDLINLMHRPNPFYTGRELRMALALSYNTDGNAYMVKIRDTLLEPRELWYIPHFLMEPHWPADNKSVFIDYYEYRVGGQIVKIPPEDVVHVRYGIDPRNVRKGFHPVKALFREIYTDDEAANFTAALLRNFGIPGLLISPAQDDVQMRRGTRRVIKEFFRQQFGGDKRGEPLVMDAKTSIEQFGFNPSELDLGRLREIPEERVTALLGVPAAVVGYGTGLQQTKVGATMKELREAGYEDCIIPMQNVMAEKLDVSLLIDFEGDIKNKHVEFDLSDVRVLQEDENKKAERITKLVEGRIIKLSEGRKQLGYDVEPEHEVWIQRFNVTVTPGGVLPQPPVQPTSTPGTNGDGKGTPLLLYLKSIIPAKVLTTQQALRLREVLLQDWLRLAAVWEPELTREYERLGVAARESFERIIQEGDLDLRSLNGEVKQGDELDDYYADLVRDDVQVNAYVEYRPQYLKVANQTFAGIESVVGLGINLRDDNELRILTVGDDRRASYLADLSTQVKDSTLRAIREARALGENPLELAKRIEESVGRGPWSTSQIRSKVVARTETKFAQNYSSLEAYRNIDGLTSIQVIDAQLGPTDEECEQLDGAIVSLTEADELMISEHPNGTRSFLPVIGNV